jgi:hypothetical protein
MKGKIDFVFSISKDISKFSISIDDKIHTIYLLISSKVEMDLMIIKN